VLDSSGVEHSDIDTVRAVWRDSWAKLAHHDPNDPRFDQSFHDETVEWVENAERSNSPAIHLPHDQLTAVSELNKSITLAEVTASVKSLSNGKSHGCDGIPAELIKHGGESLITTLHRLCNLAKGCERIGNAQWEIISADGVSAV